MTKGVGERQEKEADRQAFSGLSRHESTVWILFARLHTVLIGKLGNFYPLFPKTGKDAGKVSAVKNINPIISAS